MLNKIWSKIKSSLTPAPKQVSDPPTQFQRTAGKNRKEHPDARSRSAHPESEVPDHGKASRSKRKRRPRSRKRSGAWDPASFKVEPAEGKVRFHDLDLPNSVMHAICDLGFQYCTPIQGEILPSTLKGKDATGRAQTGTGKTAAFIITILSRLLRNPVNGKRKPGTPRVLIIAPTRELVMQIADEAMALAKYTDLNITSVFGGMDYEKQQRRLTNKRTDIVVATPGRLLDFKRRKDVDLSKVEVMIIDEADRMLDMGFIPDVRKIIYSTPHKDKRQTLFFSATLTEDVNRLAIQWTRNPVKVEIEPEQVAVDTVKQLVYIVTGEEKITLLFNIINFQKLDRVIVFCNRKDETRRLADFLSRYNINCAILSGDIRQHTRVRTLKNFKGGQIRVLVATDVAGRGIHIEGMDHVINYTLPRDPEDYVHRIGRTGRAGETGTSISFADEEDGFFIPAIEELIGHKLSCIHPEEALLTPLPPAPKRKPQPPRRRRPPSRSAKKGHHGRNRGGRPREARKSNYRRRPPKGKAD